MKIGGIEYGGQWGSALSFTLASGAVVGDAVTQTAAGEAGRGADNGELLGMVATKDDDLKGAVLIKGIQVLPKTGAISAGYVALAVNGAGLVKAGTTQKKFWVIGTDDTNNKVVVDLG